MKATFQNTTSQTVPESGVFTMGSTPDNQFVVDDPKASPHLTTAQSNLAPLELPTYEPAPHLQKQPQKHGNVKGRWISILIVVVRIDVNRRGGCVGSLYLSTDVALARGHSRTME